jgi:hypothetical protein
MVPSTFRVWIFCLLFVVAGLVTGTVPPVHGADTRVLGFEDRGQWEQWQAVTFPGVPETSYHYHEDSGAACGVAQQSASGFARRFPGSLSKWPVLSWEWKVDSVLERGNAHRQSGDDYAARVYVNFERADDWSLWESTKATVYESFYGTELPGRTLNFVWANELERGGVVKSAYTSRARLIALRTGSDSAGSWVRETVDVRKWYQRTFGGTPPPVQSVAIMTDADNTKSRARGCYRRIRLRGRTTTSSDTVE